MYTDKIRTWKDNWNDILRYVLFQDQILMQLMCIKTKIPITKFTQKYFVQLQAGSQVLTDQKVRILYYQGQGKNTGNKNVKKKYKQFDIYVIDSELHTASKDKLVNRYDLIDRRLRKLLINNCNQFGLNFKFQDSYTLWTKTQGYRRFHVVFSYYITI